MTTIKGLIRKKISERPICPKCKAECSPAGGVVGKPELVEWECWNCKYRIEDIPHEVIATGPLSIHMRMTKRGEPIN